MESFLLISAAVAVGILAAALCLGVGIVLVGGISQLAISRMEKRAYEASMADFVNAKVVKEVVLPSGGFARIRSLQGRDMQAISNLTKGGKDTVLAIIAVAVMIDDVPITIEQVEAMDMRDVLCLTHELAPYIHGPIKAESPKK